MVDREGEVPSDAEGLHSRTMDRRPAFALPSTFPHGQHNVCLNAILYRCIPTPSDSPCLQVTVRNYRKFKVLETLSAEDAKDTAGDGRGGSADVDSSSTGSGDDAESEKSISLEGSLEGVTCTCGAGCWKGGDDARSGDSVRSPSVSPCGRERKKLRSESGSATETKLSTAQERGSTAASGFGSDDAGGSPNAVGAFAPSNASFDSSSATATAAAVIPDVVGCGALVSEGNCRAFARKLETASVPGIATAAATASVVAAASGPKGQEQCRGEEENTDQSDRGDDSTETGVTTEDPISSPPGRLSPMGKGGLVSAKEMAAMKDPAAFHEALTLPFTGDSSVEAYFARIESVVSRDVSQVSRFAPFVTCHLHCHYRFGNSSFFVTFFIHPRAWNP